LDVQVKGQWVKVKAGIARHYIRYYVTQDDPDNLEWHALRKGDYASGPTCPASEAAGRIGVSHYVTPAHVFHYNKYRDQYPAEFACSPEMMKGKEEEPKMSDRLEQRVPGLKLGKVGLYASRRYPWLRASPDRIILSGPDKGLFVEFKYGVYRLYTRPRSDHMIQIHQQMAVTNRKSIYLVYGHKEQLKVIFVAFSQPFWDFCFKRLVRFRELIMDPEVKEWPAEWAYMCHEMDQYWETRKIPESWAMHCKCKHHYLFGDDIELVEKTRQTHCEFMPPEPAWSEAYTPRPSGVGGLCVANLHQVVEEKEIAVTPPAPRKRKRETDTSSSSSATPMPVLENDCVEEQEYKFQK
jgi:hypothetical protein